MKNALSLFFLFLFVFQIQAQTFKTVGYVAMWNVDTCTIQWDKLTHINLAFANPDAAGQLHIDGEDPTDLVAAAHAHGVEVFISLAGGYLQPDWEAARFVHSLIEPQWMIFQGSRPVPSEHRQTSESKTCPPEKL